ncbi:MAG TPA: PAS domain S-box protein, partial [Sunxiuqinia sp.]|nr:PAS domain S-box protein [Sunxiuqinia sp.]
MHKIKQPVFVVISGILFGGIAVLGMLMPVQFSQGIIFDGRSIILSLAGLLGGGIVAGIAVFIAGIYRVFVAGTGVFAGLASIFVSALVGLIFRHFQNKDAHNISSKHLLVVGLLATLAVCLCQFLLPWHLAKQFFTTLALPLLVVFPVVTMFIGGFIVDELKSLELVKNIKHSELLFQAMAANAPVGVFRTDMTGKTTYVNASWIGISGLTHREALGEGWKKAVHPNDQEKLMQMWQNAVKNDRSLKTEFRFLRPDGQIRWVISSASPYSLNLGATEGYIGTITDITERKVAEEALAESEESLKHAQLVAQLGHWDYDLVNNKSRWSENCYSIYGLKTNEIEPSFDYFKSRVHPDDRHLIEKAGAELIATRMPLEMELRITFSDDQIKWIKHKVIPEFENDRLVYLRGINMDITDYKLAILEIKNQKKLFETMFNSMTDGVIITDTKRNILLANKGMTDTFGYQPEELIGKSTAILYVDHEHFEIAGEKVFQGDANQSNQ